MLPPLSLPSPKLPSLAHFQLTSLRLTSEESEEESGECGTTYYEQWTCSDGMHGKQNDRGTGEGGSGRIIPAPFYHHLYTTTAATDGSIWIRNYYSDGTCENTACASISASVRVLVR